MVVDDMLADLLKFLSCVAVSLMLFYSRSYLAARGLFRGETFVLMLFALLGMMVMIAADSFLTLYLGLELHVAVAVRDGGDAARRRPRAAEAAMKYFVLGALASGMLLYGMSMIYGATGSLDIDASSRRRCCGGQGNRTILLVRPRVRRLRRSPSSSAPCRITCGCPTCTTARRRRSRC